MIKMVFLCVKLNIWEESLLNKNQMRQFYKKTLHLLSKERKNEASSLACSFLLDLSQKLNLVASFWPLDDEIDIAPFNLKMIEQNKLALPKVVGSDLLFFKVSSIDRLKISLWGILEPIDTDLIPLSSDEVSLYLVPALAFDSNFHRLGRGKGFYDKFLNSYSIHQTLGIGFKEQLSPHPLPIETHDTTLNQVKLF